MYTLRYFHGCVHKFDKDHVYTWKVGMPLCVTCASLPLESGQEHSHRVVPVSPMAALPAIVCVIWMAVLYMDRDLLYGFIM